MSQNIYNLYDVFNSLPNGAEDIPVGIGLVVAAGAAALGIRRRFDTTDEERMTQISNTAQAEASVVTERKDRRHRTLIPLNLELLGVGLVLASLAAHPETTTDHSEGGSSVAIVESMTNSMRDTFDLGQHGVSRAGAVIRGIEESGFNGSALIVQPYTSPTTTVGLTRNWDNHKAISTPILPPPSLSAVGLTTSAITGAMTNAASQLPSGPNGTRKGELIVISDGIVSDTNQMQAAQNTLAAENVSVKFIVPGTAEGSYQASPASPLVSSTVQPSSFSTFGASSIEQPQTVGAVEQDIKSAMGHASAKPLKETQPYDGFIVVGALMAIGGLIANATQRATRWL
jgi:hypothetical protein